MFKIENIYFIITDYFTFIYLSFFKKIPQKYTSTHLYDFMVFFLIIAKKKLKN